MRGVDVVCLVYGSRVVGYRLSNNKDTYDIAKDLFEDVCREESLSIGVVESITLDNDNTIEIKNRLLFKLILNDLGVLRLGLVSKTGSGLDSLISRVDNYKERYCMDSINDFLADLNCNVLALFGVRRTGKTILMYQTIRNLVRSGVAANEIYYLSIEKDKMSSDDLYCYVTAILNSNVKYLFVDEITYCTDNIDFTSIFTEKYVDKKVVIAGTDSAVFLKPFETFLYDRVSLVHTSYVSFKEYNYLYDRGIDSYVKSGGILRNSKDYALGHDTEQFKMNGYDYFSTSVIDNMFSSFEKYDLGSDFPELQNLYYTDKNNLRYIIIKWLKSYGLELTLRVLRKSYRSGDIGNLKSGRQKCYNFSEENLVEFFNKYESLYRDYIHYEDKNDFTQNQIDELKTFLKKINCLVSIPCVGSEYVVPILFRYALYCDSVLVLQNNKDELLEILGAEVDIDDFSNVMLDTLEGELYEGIIYTDLKHLGVSYKKYRRSDSEEIDLIIGNDLYEIKHSDKIIAGQCRWLLNEGFTNTLAPQSLSVVYRGTTQDVMFSQKDAVKSIMDSRKTYNKKLEQEYENASSVKKVIHYINIEEFLKSSRHSLKSSGHSLVHSSVF